MPSSVKRKTRYYNTLVGDKTLTSLVPLGRGTMTL